MNYPAHLITPNSAIKNSVLLSSQKWLTRVSALSPPPCSPFRLYFCGDVNSIAAISFKSAIEIYLPLLGLDDRDGFLGIVVAR